jgi:CDP-diacylglycerol--glycerol-3-phosphate 3-phosphatidyltransferase
MGRPPRCREDGRQLMFPLNLPNFLTLLRILLVPVLVVALGTEAEGGSELAAAVFVIAALTDGLDGYIARSRQSITTFGKVMDPVADKLLIAAALLTLVSLDRVAAWVAMIIIAREFAVSGLRIAAGQQGVVIPASALGKIKTIVQSAAVLALIVADDGGAAWVQALVYAMVLTTIVSGADYFLSFRRRAEELARKSSAATGR